MIFVDAPESEEELRLIARSIPGPVMANLSEGGKTPPLSARETAGNGIPPGHLSPVGRRGGGQSHPGTLCVLKKEGNPPKSFLDPDGQLRGEKPDHRARQYQELEKKYLRKK